MNEAQSTSALDQFVDSLLESTAQLMLILDHMQRYPSDSAAAPIDETLRRLVASVLEPEFDRRDPAELTSAAALLATAREVIGEEIFLVEPGEQLNGSPPDRRRLH
jgi:hypothetical protein